MVNWGHDVQGLAPLATRPGPSGAIPATPRIYRHQRTNLIMADEILLNEAAYAVWQTVKEKGPIELGEVVKLTGIDQAQVSAAATEAAINEYFEIVERNFRRIRPRGKRLLTTKAWICRNAGQRRG